MSPAARLWALLLLLAALLGCNPGADKPATLSDRDGDGYGDDVDCDDTNPAISPGAPEVCDDVDDDCDGERDEVGAVDAPSWHPDQDEDGYGAADVEQRSCTAPEGWLEDASDCDDLDAETSPAASELCDALDNNCDGEVDEAGALDGMAGYADVDRDGYGDPDGGTAVCAFSEAWVSNRLDCDDEDPLIHPGAPESCDRVDEDCDGVADDDPAEGDVYYTDADADGYGDDASAALACSKPSGGVATPGDCDDGDATVNPDADELCDGRDDDCDGLVDDAPVDRVLWFTDEDGDGYGPVSSGIRACDDPYGDGVNAWGDCDDADVDVNPGVAETWYDGVDEDCGGDSDYDQDGDGYLESDTPLPTTDPGSGDVVDDGTDSLTGDCDDLDAAVHPDAEESCDGVDEDCDGGTDEEAGDGSSWYLDMDDDGYGAVATGETRCESPGEGWVARAGDCDDADPDVHRGAAETWYDGIDQDCAGDSDYDRDGDGYVEAGLVDPDASTLDPGSGEIVDDGSTTEPGDCDDRRATVHPDAEESCDDVDEDCDGETDEDAEDAGTWAHDADADGYGDAVEVLACERPGSAWVATTGDCDDADPDVNPGVAETWYDGLDEDCAGDSDFDQDGDGYVTSDLDDPDQPTYDPGSGAVVDDGSSTKPDDCDDTTLTVRPGIAERCDGVDNDCDGVVDSDAPTAKTWYVDVDLDGYGVDDSAVIKCAAHPTGYASAGGDCDDGDADVNPGEVELCDDDDGLDDDCDGYTDLACGSGILRYQYGEGADPELRSCDLYWSADWGSASELCDDCDWGFAVTLTYEPDLSDNSGGCVDPDAADMVWTMSLEQRFRLLDRLYQLQDDGSWDTWDSADLDDTTGRLDFHDGDYESASGDGWLTDYWSGTAELYELTR